MMLDTENSISHDPVSETQLREAFLDDAGRGHFIILSKQDEVFIQASGEGDGPYTLEYRQGDEDHHYEGGDDLDKNAVEQAFLWYLIGDTRWRTEYKWHLLES